MLKKNKVKTEYITNKDLEKYLSEQTKTILEAVDFSLQKYSKKTDARFEKIDDQFEKIDDQFKIVNNRFNKIDTRFDELEAELKSDINDVQTLIDGYVKAQEDS